MLDVDTLSNHSLGPVIRVSYSAHGESSAYVLHLPTLSEAKSFENDTKAANYSGRVYIPSFTVNHDLRLQRWSVVCGGIVDNRPTLVNFTTLIRNSMLTLTMSLDDNDRVTILGKDNYVVKAGAFKFSLTMNGGFSFSNNDVNCLVFGFEMQFPPFQGYTLNLGSSKARKY